MTNRPQALLPRAGVLAFLAGVLLVPPAAASLVVHLDLVSLHARAGMLFHGRCTAKQEFPEAKPFPYTEYTFTVIDAVKGCRDGAGKTLETVTVRHAGTRSGYVRPDGLEVAPLRLGLPEHEVGEEAILFLTRESRLGLSAPVGLTQAEVDLIITQTIQTSDKTRAAIRLPLGTSAKIIAVITDVRGLILAHFRMEDTLTDAVDVVPAKARSAVYYSLPGGPALLDQ